MKIVYIILATLSIMVGTNVATAIDNNTQNNENVSIYTTDSDGDGISDYDEINGFIWGNITYYTDPYQKSTDFDPYDDYKEITTINMPAIVLSPGRHPIVPSYPDLKINIKNIHVNTLTKITSTESKEINSAWDINSLTVDTTNEDWGANTEINVGMKCKLGILCEAYANAKLYAYWDYSHTSTTTTLNTTSGWNREEWSMATAIDTDKVARLKYYLRIRNNGTDTAKNVQLKFNVKIGDNIITTVTTDKIANRIDPNTEYPTNTLLVIDKDNYGNDITVTLDELKSIELGAPITIEIIEIYAEVPWENNQWNDWSDYIANIDKISTKLVLDSSKVKEYRIFSGIRYPAFGDPYYFMNMTLENATLYTLGGYVKNGTVYIGEEKVEDWRFGFDNDTYSEVVKYLNNTNKTLLSIPIRQGWTVIMKPPDREPPKIHWATYTKDLKGIETSVSDNEIVKNVTAYVKIGDVYQNITLKDDDKDLIYNTSLLNKVSDIYSGYIIADDGKFSSTLRILPIPDIIVDNNLQDDPVNHTYNTIQEGIDGANKGDIIYVHNGTYEENIAIYKPVTLIGEDNKDTIIDGGNKGDVIYVRADNVQISGFKIINGSSDIYYPGDSIEIRGDVTTSNIVWSSWNFPGFFYDINDNLGTELFFVEQGNLSGGQRIIYKDNLIYQTTAEAKKLNVVVALNLTTNEEMISRGLFGFDNGKYHILGWQGERSVAIKGKADKISKLILEQEMSDHDEKTLAIGEIWDLGEGWTLKLQDIDGKARQAWLILSKDGIKKDGVVVAENKIYTYLENNITGETYVPVFVTYVDSIFGNGKSSIIRLRYTWLMSESATVISSSDEYGIFGDALIMNKTLAFRNLYNIYLWKGNDINLIGNIKFKVADTDVLRFYPSKYFNFPPPYYDMRGSPAGMDFPVPATGQNWNAYSFSGFYYDLDQNINPEKLDISGFLGRTILKDNLTYQTNINSKFFNVYKYKGLLVNGKKDYFVIGFQGNPYVAINGKANKISKLLKEYGELDRKTLAVDETWYIGEGYKLKVQEINASTNPRWARLILSRDNIILKNETVFAGENYVYSTSISNENNVIVFVTNADSVFQGATTNSVQLKYTWLISENIKEIKVGEEFGVLKVTNATSEELILKNNYALYLSRDSIVNIIGDIKFKVANSTRLRYYPVKTKKIYYKVPPNIKLEYKGVGIKLDDVNNNLFSGNNILNNSIGIGLISSDYNIMYNDYFDNNKNIEYQPLTISADSNIWNITISYGRNIIGGSWLGGSYWSDYLGNDTDDDGIGDDRLPYNSLGLIKGGGDYLPLVFDISSPRSITNLRNITYKPTYINWTWRDPNNIDFSKVMIYINGYFKGNITKSVRYYNVTGLIPNKKYTISTHTADTSGNINITWVNNSVWTDKDSISPTSITSLKNLSYAPNYIKWVWKDPTDSDFEYIMIYINGKFKTNVPKGLQYYNATELLIDQYYRIGIRTVDTSGNINQTWKNHTSKTRNTKKIYDDFNDNSTNISKWKKSVNGYGPKINETNKRLEIIIPYNSYDNNIFGAGYISKCKLKGDFDIQVDYNLLAWPTYNGVRIGIKNELGDIERTSWSSNDSARKEIYLLNIGNRLYGITNTNHTVGKLRIARWRDRIGGYYYSNGWLELSKTPIPTTDMRFNLSVWSNNRLFSDRTVKLVFDNFVINYGQLKCP